MKILLLENSIPEKEKQILSDIIQMVKTQGLTVSFPFDITYKVINKKFTTIDIQNPLIGTGVAVNGKEILDCVDGDYDVAFLVYDADSIEKPAHVKVPNPVQIPMKRGNCTVVSMPYQWYGGFAWVGADFFIHEILHAIYYLINQVAKDDTHNQQKYFQWQQQTNSKYYLHLLDTLRSDWNDYKRPVLKYKSTGDDVKLLQIRLGITSDGIFGRQTEQALKNYQLKKGLVADGICGKQTRIILGM